MTSRSSGSTDDGDESTFEPDALDATSNNLTIDGSSNGYGSGGKSSAASLKSRPSSARSRRQSSIDWARNHGHNEYASNRAVTPMALSQSPTAASSAAAPLEKTGSRSRPKRGSWSITLLVLLTAGFGIAVLLVILRSLLIHQVEPKGCRMSYMRPSYIHFSNFDTEHTRFATKYSLYLYREQGIDHDEKLQGIPVLFIPGNAGSYKQVRPIAAEAANYFHDEVRQDGASIRAGVRNLDFFTVDFNEDITAFHGQTLLDQAEYLNEAIRYILSLYSDPQRADRDSHFPDPTSVVILGHSMGGVVARAMLIQPNYQPKSINTIITMSAPHARAPVTFDGQIVHIYDEINDYWRNAYAQKWANDNPLWHVTLVSIAGGTLDTVVPSDYASLESLVPETHGFTVFTTGIPTVWTSMDHQAILWCDQFRKVVARALFDIVDINRASQTKPRADRMRLLKRRLLPGLESASEKASLLNLATTLLSLGEDSSHMVPAGARLTLSNLGAQPKPRVHLLPVPPPGSPGVKRFTLLTDALLDEAGTTERLGVLLCSVFTYQQGLASSSFSRHIDLSSGSNVSTRLACKSTAPDAVLVPASTFSSHHPFSLDYGQTSRPFTYLQYDPNHLAEHQFIAVIEPPVPVLHSFAVAEFSDREAFRTQDNSNLAKVLVSGLSFRLPSDRPTVVDVNIPAVKSALFAFKLRASQAHCADQPAAFAPLARQYTDKPYESKYFVNVREASISFHGHAPFVPPPLDPREQEGLAFQFWSDPTCNSALDIGLELDVWGSLGKLYMRYRTALAAFPLLVVSMVLRKQFQVYDQTGAFISFSEGLDRSLRRSIPLLLLSLTLLASSVGSLALFSLGSLGSGAYRALPILVDFHMNDLLIGTEDPLFCVLVPLIGIVCVGACAALHYMLLILTQALGAFLGLISSSRATTTGTDHQRRELSPVPTSSTPRRRMLSTAVLLILVSTFVPYQFAYLVACLVQIFTVVRALRIEPFTASAFNYNYYNYAHSILLLMMWVLPINLPILAVWVRNLAVHWLTPFSSHHNVLSIMPFILLVENLTTGRMVPQTSSWLRQVTSVLLFGTALCAAIYGVSHAYLLHYLVNAVAAWLVVLHSRSSSWSFANLGAMFEGNAHVAQKSGKAP
ncbi:GPI inositol-deacylase [Hirsutella minnesotensis 3608]|nr:GPI inositol-deacylase [Hirsutella minnesotensis 3608]